MKRFVCRMVAAPPCSGRHARGGAMLRRRSPSVSAARHRVHEPQQMPQHADAEALLYASAIGLERRFISVGPTDRDQRVTPVREHDRDLAVASADTAEVRLKLLPAQRVALLNDGHTIGQRGGEFICLM